MSVLPLLLGLADDLENVAVSPYYREIPALQFYRLPVWNQLKHLENKSNSAGHMPLIGKDGFQVSMDVGQFKPSELNVKVVVNDIIVEGKHEEREDEHGYISRHFVRRYRLPKGYEPDKVVSTLSSDGVLTVSALKPAAIEDKTNERVIQIQQTGPAHLNIKDNAETDEQAKDKNKEKENDGNKKNEQ